MEKELAIGIGFEGNCLTGFAVNSEGQIVNLPLKNLYKCGLPTIERLTRQCTVTDFSDWREISAMEYVKVLGISFLSGLEIHHQCFEFVQGKSRFVIPALALMRGLFRPSKHLLPVMFLPQALDQIGALRKLEGQLTFEIDTNFVAKSAMDRAPSLHSLINWMYSYPSALSMAGSVHQYAVNGHLGLRLPQARVRIVLRGHKVAQTLFVTDASVVAITPGDSPELELSGLQSVVLLNNVVTTTGRSVPERIGQFVVPLHANGSVELSDDEWRDVQASVLRASLCGQKIKLSQRGLLDGVLTKLVRGTPWRKMNYPVGNWQNACTMFHNLAKSKKLESVLEILSESRKKPEQ